MTSPPIQPAAEGLVLLTPGPVMVSPRVRQALAHAEFSHRDPAFARLLTSIGQDLAVLAGALRHDPIVLAASATAAIEAAFATLVGVDDKLLIVSNGAFGERLAEIADVLGLPMRHLRYPWGHSMNLGEVEQTLDDDPAITSVAMVHHDTSVGLLNPVQAVGALAGARGLRVFVDVVSSLGAEPFDAEASHASVVIGSGNKCLEGVPGASFVLVRPDGWKPSGSVTPRTLYLDLRRYRSSSTSTSIPFTPAVQVVAALHAALGELADEGGPVARHRRYQARKDQIGAGFRTRGLHPYFDECHQRAGPCSVTLASLPSGQTSDSWYDALRRRGFLVYQAKAALRERCFLTANMGHLSEATIDRFLEAVDDALTAIGREGPATPAAVR